MSLESAPLRAITSITHHAAARGIVYLDLDCGHRVERTGKAMEYAIRDTARCAVCWARLHVETETEAVTLIDCARELVHALEENAYGPPDHPSAGTRYDWFQRSNKRVIAARWALAAAISREEPKYP